MHKKFGSLLTSAIIKEAGIQAKSSIKAVFLPNVKMANKRRSFVNKMGPDPSREINGFIENAVLPLERDLHSFPLNPLEKKGSFLAGFDLLRALKVLIFDRDVDVIISVFESNIFFILLLRRLLRFRPKIVLWEVSGRGWPMRDRVLDYVLPRVDQVLVLTSDQKRAVDSTYHLKSPAKILGFAVDDLFFQPCVQKNHCNGYVLAVGDDISRDYSTLIEACHRLGLPLKLRSNSILQETVDTAGLLSVVERLTYTELRDLYANATIVVVPLKAVDYPSGITAVFEAMAMGKALIASKTGTTLDFINSGENGILVAPQNVNELGEALAELWVNAPFREKLGNNARAFLERDFSYEKYIEKFALLLHKVVEKQ